MLNTRDMILRPAIMTLILALGASSQAAAASVAPWYAEPLAALGFQVFPVPQPAPEIQLESLKGGAARLSDFKGKTVVLNFWATWCPPCREEMPALQALWDKTGERPFVLLAVSVGESRQTVRSFAEKNGYDMPIYLDPTGKAGGAYGARSIPTTFVLDKEGRAIAYAVGGREYDSPEALAFFAELAAR